MSVSDDFNRTNASPPLASPWSDPDSIGSIVSNQLSIGGAGGQVQWAANSWNADQFVQMVAVNGASAGSASHQIWLRTDSGRQNGYVCLIDGAPNLRYGVDVAGSISWILAGGGVANGDTIAFTITGSNLNETINGVPQGGASDSTYSAAGLVWIGGIPGTIIDDFFATGEIAAASSFLGADRAHQPQHQTMMAM
jgi:hypothetical protein